MIYYVLLGICVVICFILLFLNGIEFNSFAIPLCVLAGGSFVLLIIGSVLLDGLKTEYVITDSKSLKSISFESSDYAEGSFFLCFGSYEEGEEEKYTYMVEEGLGYVMKDINVSEVIVQFDNESSPQLITYRKVLMEDSFASMIYGKGKGDYVGYSENVFIVPENSIAGNYSLDMKESD